MVFIVRRSRGSCNFYSVLDGAKKVAWQFPISGIALTGVDRFNMAAAEYFEDRTDVQCLHRWQKVLNPELVKGPWTAEVRSTSVPAQVDRCSLILTRQCLL